MVFGVSLNGELVLAALRYYTFMSTTMAWPTGLMVKASVSGVMLAEDSGFESQVGRFFLLIYFYKYLPPLGHRVLQT
jgi:hypothetical protein